MKPLMLIMLLSFEALGQSEVLNNYVQEGLKNSQTLKQQNFQLQKAVFALSEVRLGLVPAVIAPYVVQKIGIGAGASQRSAIAVTIIGGQTLCLLLTLLVVPVGYSLVEDLKALVSRRQASPVPAGAPGD